MAYADRSATGSRMVAMVIVAVILFGVGYAFVTGLAMNFVKKAQEKLNTFDVQQPPPPPPDEPPPPPPPDHPTTPPPVVTPPPIVQPPVVIPQAVVTVPTAPIIAPAPPAPPAPPSPPAPPAPPPPKVVSQAAKSKGDPHGWFSTDDYPAAALRANAGGRVQARLTIGTDGRVSACNVTSSSGNSDLDDATCRVAQRRGRYTAAKDQNGQPIAATDNISIVWTIPKD